MKRATKKHERMTKAELVQCIKALEREGSPASLAVERDQLLHELQVHQVELETQNRELREAQLLLEGSRDRYADLYDFAPVGYVTFDDKGVIREINLTAAGMLGVDRTRLIGVPFHLHVAREDLAHFRAHLDRHENPVERVATELRLARKDGVTLPVVMQSVLVYDSEKKTHLCRAALTDITARRQAEMALRASTHQLQTLSHAIEQSPASVLITTPTGEINYVNQKFTEVTGYSSLEVLGKNPRVLKSGRQPPEFYKAMWDTITAGREWRGEFCNRKKNGELFWEYAVIAPVIGSDGKVRHFVAIKVDITERRRALENLREREERLRAILNTVADAVITIDPHGLIQNVNPATVRMFGYAEAEMIGQNVKMLMPSPFHEEHDGYLDNYHRTGEAKIIGIGREVRGQRKDGTSFPIDLAVGKVDHLGLFTGVIRDMTERKKLELALVDATEREQRKFGHELHDGLGQRLTGLEMLSHALAEELKDHPGGLAGQARRLNRELRETVTEARLISHGLAPVPLDRDGLMRGLNELALRTCRHKGVKCRLFCEPPVLVEDQDVATHLYRIAQEAVTNALKHGKASRIDIRLTEEAGRLKLCVENNGRPLPVKDQSREGVGLNAMRYRVALMGGTLAIESGKRRGFKVTCTLRRNT